MTALRQALLDEMRARAKVHAALFPTFDLARFLDRCDRKSTQWLNQYRATPIATINKKFHKLYRYGERMT